MEQAVFFGLPLLATAGEVMTPRPATEQLVTMASERIGNGSARVADVGTGSGAIAVALALAAPGAEIWASDVSAAAVLVARANALRFSVDDRVHAVRGDLLAPVPGGLDLVLANLPYLPLGERGVHPDLRDEPESAVFASGDGLDPYRRLLSAAEQKLASGGAVAIQLHRRIFVAEHAELAWLCEALPELVPSLPAAA